MTPKQPKDYAPRYESSDPPDEPPRWLAYVILFICILLFILLVI